MTFGALAFMSPWLLGALATLPIIYWLLRAVPPNPARVEFPPTRILVGLENEEKTADKTPWWLTLIRLLAATFVILALAEPVLNPAKDTALKGSGPLVIVADNGWSSASRWPIRLRMIDRLITEAESQNRPVILLPTAAASKNPQPKIEPPGDARTTAAALQPQPYAPNRRQAVAALETALKTANAASPSIIWLHDGIDHNKDAGPAASALLALAGQGSFAVIDETKGEEAIGIAAQLGEKGKLEALVLSATGNPREGSVHAYSARGERLGETPFKIASGETAVTVPFELPLELRNQVARIEIPAERSAGAVSLIDAATQWHRVGLISGESREQAQPLLAPLYYIQKALLPFAELAVAKDANLAANIETILKQNVSVLVLADIGTISGESEKLVEEFVKRGGALVRFAGPRLEKGGDELLPVPLRAGGRSMGGALSWSTPQSLAAFEETSPFAGLAIPPDVTIKRQVLADPSKLSAEVEIWAQAFRWHTARHINAAWRRTPCAVSHHGKFRLVELADLGTICRYAAAHFDDGTHRCGRRAAGATSSEDAKTAETQSVLPPLKTLDGLGSLKPPPPTAEPVKTSEIAKLQPSLEHPPGYYGNSVKPHALNVLTPKSTLLPMPSLPNGVQRLTYDNAASTPLKPWMLALALGLLFADILAVLILQAGGWRHLAGQRATAQAAAFVALVFAASAVMPIDHAIAQESAPEAGVAATPPAPSTATSQSDAAAIAATNKVSFAYVQSGDAETDEVSRLGLTGLGKVLSTRTAVDPGPPHGVDIVKDEIAFFPVLYWPVIENSQTLPDSVLAKIDAYMKEGGLVLFDTRDYGQGGVNQLPIGGKSGNALQRLLGKLDVPRLEPVPENHVLTKSFYLLKSFPGRWDGGQLWVEAITDTGTDTRKARVADGVTSIMITSNDFAAAWALDERGRPLYPVVPGGEDQREMAFRSGVNIVMHALTGNYKADQVHVPALLERLGQ